MRECLSEMTDETEFFAARERSRQRMFRLADALRNSETMQAAVEASWGHVHDFLETEPEGKVDRAVIELPAAGTSPN